MTSETNLQLNQARDTFHTLLQIAQLLQTGLDAESLTLCIQLCELGVNPDALALAVKEIRKMSDPNGNLGDENNATGSSALGN